MLKRSSINIASLSDANHHIKNLYDEIAEIKRCIKKSHASSINMNRRFNLINNSNNISNGQRKTA